MMLGLIDSGHPLISCGAPCENLFIVSRGGYGEVLYFFHAKAATEPLFTPRPLRYDARCEKPFMRRLLRELFCALYYSMIWLIL